MTRVHLGRWLSEQAKTGLRDLPSNANWLLSQVAEKADGKGLNAKHAISDARQRAEQMKGSVAGATGFGDSVESRMERASEQSERAKQAGRAAADLAHEKS